MATNDEAKPAFTDRRTIAAFEPQEVLKFEGGGRLAVVKGLLKTDGDGEALDILVQLEQRAAVDSEDALLALLPRLDLTLTNHSGAEYSYYDGMLSGVNYNVEVIWPASARQVR